jgi:predicted phosphodiesterase
MPMRIHLISDLHNECSTFEPDQDAVSAADVIVLAGDIALKAESVEYAKTRFSGKPVILIAGNHEHYKTVLDKNMRELKEAANSSNVFFLENNTVQIDGVTFWGATLPPASQLLSPL